MEIKSRYFTEAELLFSSYAIRHGLDNTPKVQERANLLMTAQRMDDVRELLRHPVTILSGYRAPKVNKGVGGAQHSQHMLGQAMDFLCPGFGTPREIAEHIAASAIPFDQMILEYDRWVHISFVPVHPRGEVLTKTAKGYKHGIK